MDVDRGNRIVRACGQKGLCPLTANYNPAGSLISRVSLPLSLPRSPSFLLLDRFYAGHGEQSPARPAILLYSPIIRRGMRKRYAASSVRLVPKNSGQRQLRGSRGMGWTWWPRRRRRNIYNIYTDRRLEGDREIDFRSSSLRSVQEVSVPRTTGIKKILPNSVGNLGYRFRSGSVDLQGSGGRPGSIETFSCGGRPGEESPLTCGLA